MNWFKFSQSAKQQASKLLGNDKSKLQEVKQLLSRTTNPSKHYAYLSYLMSKDIPVNSLNQVINEVESLLNENKVKTISANGSGITLIDSKDNKYNADNLIKFQEVLHAIESSYKPLVETSVDSLEEMKHKIVYEGNNITVYKADGPGDCIALGEGQSFCISRKDSQNAYHTYRNQDQSTFYFVYDRNFESTHPLNIVVVDVRPNIIKLTDKNNNTGTIDTYKQDSNSYLEYLKSKGVPIGSLINNPLSEEEIAENNKLGVANYDLSWFKELTREEKYKYISRYHQLTGDQFKEIFSDKELLKAYLSNGHPLDYYDIKTLNNNQLSIYKHAREKIINNDNATNHYGINYKIEYSDSLLFGKEILEKSNIIRTLRDCAKYGPVEDLEYLLSSYISKETDNRDSYRSVDAINDVYEDASYYNNIDVAKYVLYEYKEHIRYGSIYDSLTHFATYDNLDMIKFIYNLFNEEITDYYTEQLLMNSSIYGSFNIIKYLFDKFEYTPFVIQSSINSASRNFYPEIQEYLENKLKEVNKNEKESNNWFSLIKMALVRIPNLEYFEDIVEKLYELEYKHHMLSTKEFIGHPRRKQNILLDIELKINHIIDKLKTPYLKTLKEWIDLHNVENLKEFAETRAKDNLSENNFEYAIKEMYEQISDMYDKEDYSALENEINDLIFSNQKIMKIVYKNALNLFEHVYKKDMMDATKNPDNEQKVVSAYNRMFNTSFSTRKEVSEYVNSIDKKQIALAVLGDLSIKSYDRLNEFLSEKEQKEVIEILYVEFFYPYWLKYWKKFGLIKTVEKVKKVYDLLLNAKTSNESVAAINLAINLSHQTDSFMYDLMENKVFQFRGKYTSDVFNFLKEMTNNNTKNWDKDLKEIGVKI